MKRNCKLTTLTISAVLIIGIGIYIFFKQKTNITNHVQTGLPPTIFDGRIKIPNTSTSVAYPKQGFYGKGIKILPYNMENNLLGVTGGIGLAPSSTLDDGTKSEYINITLDARKAQKINDLESLISNILKDSRGPEYLPNGMTTTINNGVYYIAKSKSDSLNIFDAYTQMKKEYIHVQFDYTEGTGQINKAAAENNEKLFNEYLNHLDIKEN